VSIADELCPVLKNGLRGEEGIANEDREGDHPAAQPATPRGPDSRHDSQHDSQHNSQHDSRHDSQHDSQHNSQHDSQHNSQHDSQHNPRHPFCTDLELDSDREILSSKGRLSTPVSSGAQLLADPPRQEARGSAPPSPKAPPSETPATLFDNLLRACGGAREQANMRQYVVKQLAFNDVRRFDATGELPDTKKLREPIIELTTAYNSGTIKSDGREYPVTRSQLNVVIEKTVRKARGRLMGNGFLKKILIDDLVQPGTCKEDTNYAIPGTSTKQRGGLTPAGYLTRGESTAEPSEYVKHLAAQLNRRKAAGQSSALAGPGLAVATP